MRIMVYVGELAPDFTLPDGKRLSDLKGKEVVLYFYPKDDTPGCTAEACSLRDTFEHFTKKNILVIGISKDNEKKHKKFKEKYHLPFELLADTEAKVCKLYEVWGKKKFMGLEYEGIIRTTFLIDKENKIKEIIKEIHCTTHGNDLLAKF